VINFQPAEGSALTYPAAFPSPAARADPSQGARVTGGHANTSEEVKTKQYRKWQKEKTVSRLIAGKTYLGVQASRRSGRI